MAGSLARRFRISIPGVAVAVSSLFLSGVGAIPVLALAQPGGAPPPLPRMAHVTDVGVIKPHPVPAVKSPVSVPTATSWPAAGAAVVSLQGGAGTGGASAAPAPLTPSGAAAQSKLASMTSAGPGGGLPVWVQRVAGRAGDGVRSVRVSVLPHAAAVAAGVRGVVFTLAPVAGSSAGAVRAVLSYAGFAQVAGGNYGLSLGLVQLASCALTTPAGQPARRRPRCGRR